MLSSLQKKVSVTSVKEEGRQAKHSTNYSDGGKRPPPAVLIKNNRPLVKRPSRASPPHPSPYKRRPPPPATLRLMSEGFPRAQPASAHAI